jgi:acetyltransferase-like isoleucine patch superfamily enzyme
MDLHEFRNLFLRVINNADNPYHPLVWINGSPEIGEKTYIGGFSEVNAKNARVRIGKHCDIASFVAINVADSHRKCLQLSERIAVQDIEIGDYVFVGSHSAILGGAIIGHHCVIAAGTVVRTGKIPPFSLVYGNPAVIKPQCYQSEYEALYGRYVE